MHTFLEALKSDYIRQSSSYSHFFTVHYCDNVTSNASSTEASTCYCMRISLAFDPSSTGLRLTAISNVLPPAPSPSAAFGCTRISNFAAARMPCRSKTQRGPILDQAALVDALRTGDIAGAAHRGRECYPHFALNCTGRGALSRHGTHRLRGSAGRLSWRSEEAYRQFEGTRATAISTKNRKVQGCICGSR